MNLLAKFRETAFSVLPVMGIVTVLGLAVDPPAGTELAPGFSVEPLWLPRFLAGGALLVVGLTVFLLGVDLGISPMGERCGAALTRRRSLALLLGAAFAIGFVVTAAEPDVQVFGDQVRGVFPAVRKAALTFSIAGGVGLFMSFGLLRSVLRIPVKTALAIAYGLLLLLAVFAPSPFVGVAFDSGGATTGPMTVPFIMAIGLGVVAVRARGDGEGGFGLTGIASVGPVAAVLVYAIVNANVAAPAPHAEVDPHAEFAEVDSHAENAENAEPDSHAESAESAEPDSHAESAENAEPESHAEFAEVDPHAVSAENAEPEPHAEFAKRIDGEVRCIPRVFEEGGFFASFRHSAPEALRETSLSILPLLGLFLAFQFLLLRMTARQFARHAIGVAYAFVGLLAFLTGVNGGFMQAGRILGATLGAAAAAGGAGAWALLLGTGLALGAIVVCAEPAVWVLGEQVEQASGGNIRRRALLVFLSAGTALAVGLATWRAVAGFPVAWALVPGYAAAMALMVRSPALFTGIAFDSGGVASGPLTSTFVLSFTLGAAAAGRGGNDSFGVIALVAMMPLAAIQPMGILVERRKRRALRAPAAPAPTPGEETP